MTTMFFIIEVLKWIIGIPVLLLVCYNFGRWADYECKRHEPNGIVIDYGYDETSKAINN